MDRQFTRQRREILTRAQTEFEGELALCLTCKYLHVVIGQDGNGSKGFDNKPICLKHPTLLEDYYLATQDKSKIVKRCTQYRHWDETTAEAKDTASVADAQYSFARR